jgi:hypothetical protein
MPVLSPAIGIQSGSHTAKAFRQLACALAGAEVQTFVNSVTAVDVGHGLVRSTHLTVTQRGAGVNMSVDVAKGTALVNGSSSLAQGIYAVTNDATTNLAIATADAVNPRRDLVVIQVRDNTEDAGGSNDARLFVVTGTPAASPADPAIPAGCLVLARVAVAALAASITNANITALAGLAAGSAWNQAWGVVPGGYQQATTNQTGITTVVDLTSLTVTWNAVAGRRYRITVQTLPTSTVANDGVETSITTGAGSRVKGSRTGPMATLGEPVSCDPVAYVVPGAGSQTYKARMQRSLGTGSITNNATSDNPSFICVEDVGPN